MNPDALPERLEALVDFLRGQKDRHVTLTEIASVTEVLIATMTSYFRSIDTAIYQEFRYLSEYITRARGEISQLHPVELKTRQIPRAGRELDAIVAATEEATNTIMEAAETIMAAEPSDPEGYKTIVDNSVMTIFEACSFQDITGQRICKVVETLSVIEQRLHRLGEVWGAETGPALPADDMAADHDDPGMSGPALEGEGIDQDGVDALLSDDTMPAAEEADAPAAEAAFEGRMSEDEIDRLMNAEHPASDPAPDAMPQPANEMEYGTAEQLVRAVETLLQEDAEDPEAGSIEHERWVADQAERREIGEVSNDDVPPRARVRAVSGGGKSKTTQADIDALFS
jgi:chemotaxis regulatin CheY-phosphate phosphatase CheZ